MNPKEGDTIVVWFSCGAASAVAAKCAIFEYGHMCNIRVVNTPIAEEHPDNRRFLRDVEKWIGQRIEILTHSKHPESSCVTIWDNAKYMSGTKGAPCTKILKKQARYEWEEKNKVEWMVMGFTVEEKNRYDRFVLTERENTLNILGDWNMSKQDCFNILIQHKIELPLVYHLGLPNANCIGCVKATSPTYWNHVRKMFPEVFKQRAEQSRRLGAKLVRYKGNRIFLDELPPDAKGRPMKALKMPECGIFCEEKF